MRGHSRRRARSSRGSRRRPKDEVIFETGYGPSGLPHIGTFGEVARTTMVRHAFRVLTDDKVKTRLIAFSDDMDGLRKVPDNVPNKEMLAAASRQAADRRCPTRSAATSELRRSTTMRGCAPSSTTSASTTSSCRRPTATRPGRFDATLLHVLERFDEVMAIMLPSLREERAQTYSPFLPISPTTGMVLQVPIVEHDAERRHHRLRGSRHRASASTRRSPAGTPSCSGSPTGRCAGSRSASTTRWPART